MKKADKIPLILETLQALYPEPEIPLNSSSPFTHLVAVLLSAQCTDKQVNIVTADLFKKYRCAADYTAVPLESLQEEIKRIGLFRNKAKSIQNCCRALIDNHDGNVPAEMKALVALAGVGRKTANVVLGNAFNINEGVVVDTHVARLSRRLGLASEKTAEKVEAVLQKLVLRDDWTIFSHWLIWHGRRRCSARKPKCSACEIAALCPSEKGGEYCE